MTRAVLVLGMHRSGTSALARVLNLLGVDLGSDLLPPAADNESGFWEHRRVQLIHDRVYQALDRDWTTVSPLPAAWWDRPDVAPFRGQLRAELTADFAASPVWGVKDPRLCAMLPLWRPLLADMGCDAGGVLIFRNPAEVARSLGKRDGFAPSRVHLLWLRGVIDAERHSRGLPRTATSYGRLLADWPGQVRRIADALSLTWPTPPERVAAAVDSFIRPTARHHSVGDDRFLADRTVPEPVRSVYAAALAACASGDLGPLSVVLDQAAADLDGGDPLLSDFVADLEAEHRAAVVARNVAAVDGLVAVRHAAEQVAAGQRRSAEAEAEVARFRDDRDRWHAEAVAAHARLGDERAQAVARHALLSEAIAEVDALSAELVAARASAAAVELEAARQRVEHVAQMNRVMETASNANAAAQADARDRVAVLAQELDAYRVQRAALLDVAGRVWTSRSWRWTAPLRRLVRRPLTAADLAPVGPLERLGPDRWRSSGRAEFVLPCLPVAGRVRVRLRMACDAETEAVLYFDTGRLFNAAESVPLGTVAAGRLDAERTVTLTAPVHCFRLDPVQVAAAFTIEAFEIVPT